MRLDRAAFEDVRVDGTLREELDALKIARFFFKHADELGADDLALLFRVADACELIKEAVHRIHIDEVRVHLSAEHGDHLLRFALAQKAVVHMYADELLADCPDEQRGDDG